MDHNEIRHRLSEYIDNAVTDDERAAIESHLATCTECAEALRELRKSIEHIRAVQEVEPPAGMTQHIMATVRKTERRKSIMRSLVDHFIVLRPVQVLAVLSLAVTVYYIYLNLEPVGKYAESPLEIASKQEAPAVGPARAKGRMSEEALAGRGAKPEHPAGKDASVHRKDVAQSPEYRSLDMKYSYEKPARPEPAAPPAAEPTRPMTVKEPLASPGADAVRSLSGAPRAAAPAAGGPQEAAQERDEAKRPVARSSAPTAVIQLTLQASDVSGAAGQAAQAVTNAGGRIIRREEAVHGAVIQATVRSDVLPKLRKALQQIGSLREKALSVVPAQEMVTMEIVVSRTSLDPAP
jgi:hypothetical protein